MSPSPSRSAACTSAAPTALIEMAGCAEKPSSRSLRYHAILLSKTDAESTSMSPSPSRSAACTSAAPSAFVEMTNGSENATSPRPPVGAESGPGYT